MHALTNDIHNGKDVFITIGAVLPISGQMAVAYMEVTFCVWLISPRWIASGKFPWYVKRTKDVFSTLQVASWCLKHIAKRTNVARIMGRSVKIPRMKGRDLTLVRSIVVHFCLPFPHPPPPTTPPSLSLSLKFIGEITLRASLGRLVWLRSVVCWS